MNEEEIVADHPDDIDINPPDPIEHEDGSVEYPTDPDYSPPDDGEDWTPVEADEDYSPPEEEGGDQ